MDDKLLRKVQLAELDILVKVKDVCEKNDIKFFLTGGTLLGAVRHGGFIPWDDDIDIGMLRPEYEKFIGIAQKELGDSYFLQTWDTDPEFPFASAKVRKLGTLYRESSAMKTNYHSELFIDIFPYDNYPETIEAQKEQGRLIDRYRKTFMMKAGMTPWRMSNNPVKRIGVFVKNIPYMVRGMFIDKGSAKQNYHAVMTKYNKMETLRVFEECNGTNYGRFVVPRVCIGKLKPIVFEGLLFSGPENTDAYLSAIYGDYMTPPPASKRANHAVYEVRL